MELLNIITDLITNVSERAQGGALIAVVGIIVTIIRKRKIPLKYWLGRGTVITRQTGEAFLSISNVFAKADAALKADGKLNENSVKEVIEAGKQAKIECNDVILEIKPK